MVQPNHWSDNGKIVHELFRKIEQAQDFTAQHSLRASKIAVLIGKQMKISDRERLAYLEWGVLLHDYGKLFIPKTLLLKADKLTLEEYETVTQHVNLGYERLKDCVAREVLEIIIYHHERYDGEGYPHALTGDQIPLLAQICSVAEAYDAMVESTTYHKGMTTAQAAEEIIWNSGTQFGPDIVTAFLKCELFWEKTGSE